MKRYAWLLVILAAGCSQDALAPGELAPVNRVGILPAPGELLLDDTLRLSAIGLSAGGDTLRGRQVTWSSSDPSVIAVSPGGAATAIAPGTVTIAASIEGKQDTVTLNALALSITSISAGADHTCGLTTSGEVWCWGANDKGQLGIGPLQPLDSRTPRRIAGGLLFKAIAAGIEASCGLLQSGGAECWGDNSTGQLGDGTLANRVAPTAVQGSLTFSTISAPATHTCGILLAGGQRCWGENTFGQLGDGTRINRLIPVAVLGGHTLTQIFTSDWEFSCGLDSGNAAWCWGEDFYGSLGHDTTYFSTTPALVAGGLAFTQVSARSARGCGLGAGGVVYCWGIRRPGYDDQLSVVPTPEPSAPALVSVSEGGQHTCGLTASGQAWCWGANDHGQLGNGTIGIEGVDEPPGQVTGGLTFTSLSAGIIHTCGIVVSGDAYCWGANGSGMLGVGNSVDPIVSAPALVAGGLAFTAISSGTTHTCGLAGGGIAYCWGFGYNGELGDGTLYHLSPAPVAGGFSFQSIVARDNSSCGIASGAAYCWGNNYSGQLGDGTTTSHPIPNPVSGGLSFSRLALGRVRTCGVDLSGAAYCWGSNRNGALGNGTETDALVPVSVAGGHNFSDIAAGDEHVCAMTSQGVAYCWGDNVYGELGNGISTDSPIPVPAAAGLAFVSIGSSERRSCGLTATGDTYCWPTDFREPDPVLVPGGIHFTQLSVGQGHACGLTSNGQAYCWGLNSLGQLGNGNLNVFGPLDTIPVPVTGGLIFTRISAGAEHTCGITAGGAFCWGANRDGELGISGFEDIGGIPYPVKVRGQR
ncbi:MAG TPA: Ig-like domain-containing protein [Gemmatimonadales bacterium]|nr:Ig-like domain-containing protein [Gemmatimonadales bacterium]